jgi:hypothetical protein
MAVISMDQRQIVRHYHLVPFVLSPIRNASIICHCHGFLKGLRVMEMTDAVPSGVELLAVG